VLWRGGAASQCAAARVSNFRLRGGGAHYTGRNENRDARPDYLVPLWGCVGRLYCTSAFEAAAARHTGLL